MATVIKSLRLIEEEKLFKEARPSGAGRREEGGGQRGRLPPPPKSF